MVESPSRAVREGDSLHKGTSPRPHRAAMPFRAVWLSAQIDNIAEIGFASLGSVG